MTPDKISQPPCGLFGKSMRCMQLILCIAVLLLIQHLQGQNCVPRAIYFQNHDLVLTSGNKESPCLDVLELSFEVPPILRADWPSPDLSQSWLCPDSNCSINFVTNDQGYVTSITLARNDHVPQSGKGEVARFSPYILVDNVDIRSPKMKNFHDYDRHCLYFQGGGHDPDSKLGVFNLKGKSMGNFQLRLNGPTTIDTNSWQSGIYFVRLHLKANEVLIQKILVL